jgi:pyruvate kinase
MNTEPQTAEFERLIAELTAIRATMLDAESSMIAKIERLHPAYRASARNLVHYLALRRHDLRPLQAKLSVMGLSSLGRAEASVTANVEAVLRALLRFAGGPSGIPPCLTPITDYAQGKKLLERHTEDLLGPKPATRIVRIMVTMPTEAATNPALIETLMRNGMDCLRINCAHDGPGVWEKIVANLRHAEQLFGRKCRVLMDLAGPKLRTGPLIPGPEVVKWRPRRDPYGRVTAPARIWLYPSESPVPAPAAAAAAIPVPGLWLAHSRAEDEIAVRDTRERSRSLRITEEVGDCRWAAADQTAYVKTGTRLELHPAKPCDLPSLAAAVGRLPPQNQHILLKKGDRLLLTRSLEPGHPALHNSEGCLLAPACIGCTLPEVFRDVRPGERIFLDDGKIGGIVRSATPEQLEIDVIQARPRGEKLRADKGINLPDSRLDLPALTPKDIEDLKCVIALADMVGYSFVRSAADVDALESHLAPPGRPRPGNHP